MRLAVNKKEQCVGCRQCEATCSIAHENVFAPWLSRVRIDRDEFRLIATPIICRQCKRALCKEACQFGAINYNEEGILVVNNDKCVGCGECIKACPFKAMVFDEKKAKALKCDLCGGNPKCADVCPAHVLIKE